MEMSIFCQVFTRPPEVYVYRWLQAGGWNSFPSLKIETWKSRMEQRALQLFRHTLGLGKEQQVIRTAGFGVGAAHVEAAEGCAPTMAPVHLRLK